MTAGETSDNPERPSLAAGVLRMLVRETTRAPLVALSLGLRLLERTRELRDQVRRRGDEALQLAAHTPLGRFLPQPLLSDDAEAEGRRIAEHARETTRIATPPEPATTPNRRPAPRPQERSVGATPAAREAGAPGVATNQVEQVIEHLSIAEPSSRQELPIPDFDNASLASLRGRLRSLSVEQLVMLREWEREHAHRLPVITLLDNRIAKLSGSGEDRRGVPRI